ncbi:inner centromere protein-like isoform X3 [Tyto alba]|uniref:inner centromere protein-like isoform X3 n=1 Tax=Tyto alba TaxID=56313 RepID=UPI001C67C0F2|nr:inner centromere protein-like isoform X3 [Tyto alba]
MAGAGGPVRLLELCGQRLSRFLRDAEHKRLVWLQEVEEQGVRMLDSNFGAEPELMPKTPSQRRRPKKRQSSCLNDENKEPNRRRLSRRRSSSKPVSSKPSSQRRHSKEQSQNPCPQGEEVSVANCAVRSQASVKTELPALTGKRPAEAQAPVMQKDCQGCPWGAGSGDTVGEAVMEDQLPRGDAATELHDVSSVAASPGDQTARDGEEAPKGRASTSTPKTARNADPAVLQGHRFPQGFKKVFFQDSDSKITTVKSKTRRCSGRRSFVGGPHRSSRASLAEKYSLAGKRESMIRRSISRAISKKAAARESSSASSRVSCQSALEVFVEDVTSSVRPGLEQNPSSEKTPEDVLISSKSTQAASPPAQHLSTPEQQAGNKEGICVNPNSEPQNVNQEQHHCAKSQENPSCSWTRSYKQAVGVTQNGQRPAGHALSPLDDKYKNSANQTPPSSSPARKVVRPLKNFLQAVQRNQLLASPGPTGRGGVIKNFIKRNTSTRPDLKGDFVEKERQRLESLRKKQEAEEQRKKKVEEEKRRRQAEMKQKREERLRKALQARERVEQMEEEKKKRMEQRILQNDEKEKDEFEQQEPLQRREDEVKEKRMKVLELKNLVEQQQVEEVKERDHKQRGKEKAPKPQLESALLTEKNIKKEDGLQEPQKWLGVEKKIKEVEAWTAASGTWLSRAVKKSIPTPYLRLPKGTKQSRSPEVDKNNYGMDLNSDDSTDDENDPRKPVPAWADGAQLNEAILHQYYHPVNVDQVFGLIPSPKLEDIFGKSKPRYFKRTSSAVWHSPPGTKSTCGPSCSFKN